MSEKQIEETEKPFILVIGFFLHITIAFWEGWLAPSYLITFYLFLIIPYVIIIPRLETHIATYNCDYLTSTRHLLDCLLSVLAVVLVALIKTLSHRIVLNRAAPRADMIN